MAHKRGPQDLEEVTLDRAGRSGGAQARHDGEILLGEVCVPWVALEQRGVWIGCSGGGGEGRRGEANEERRIIQDAFGGHDAVATRLS